MSENRKEKKLENYRKRAEELSIEARSTTHDADRLLEESKALTKRADDAITKGHKEMKEATG